MNWQKYNMNTLTNENIKVDFSIDEGELFRLFALMFRKIILACIFVCIGLAFVSAVFLTAYLSGANILRNVCAGLIVWTSIIAILTVVLVLIMLIYSLVCSKKANEYAFSEITILNDCLELKKNDVVNRIFYRELAFYRTVKDYSFFKSVNDGLLILPMAIIPETHTEYIKERIRESLAKKYMGRLERKDR